MDTRLPRERLVVYAHFIKGDQQPFYYGSGRTNRPNNLERGAEWRDYVASRLGTDFADHLDQIEVRIVGEYSCEGQMRRDECMLAAEGNTLGNRVGAARSSVDMLTGLLKGAKQCRCGSLDCRRKIWLAMGDTQQDAEMRHQLSLASRNRLTRGMSPIDVDAKLREYARRRSEGHHWFHELLLDT